MKRILALALALLICGCALAEGNWYVEEGQALALRMQALAADEAYFHVYATGNDGMNALREAFGQADLTKPTGAWFLALPEAEELRSALERMASMGGAEADMSAIDELSDVGWEELVKRLPASAATILTAQSGVEWVALSSVLTVSAPMEEPEDFTPGYLLLEYPGEFGALITFSRLLPGFVSVSALSVPANSLETVRPMLSYAKVLGLELELEALSLE